MDTKPPCEHRTQLLVQKGRAADDWDWVDGVVSYVCVTCDITVRQSHI